MRQNTIEPDPEGDDLSLLDISAAEYQNVVRCVQSVTADTRAVVLIMHAGRLS